MVKLNPAINIEALESRTVGLTFAALADPTRRAMIARMAEPEAAADGISVNDLAEPFLADISLPAVSKHLRVLERAGLLQQKKDGRVRRCYLEAKSLQQAYNWVSHYRRFWSQQLDALADFLEHQPDSESRLDSSIPPTKTVEGKNMRSDANT